MPENILEPTPAPPPPAAAPVPSGQEPAADLRLQKLRIESDPDFLSGTRDPARHTLLAEEWRRIADQVYADEAPAPAPVAGTPAALMEFPEPVQQDPGVREFALTGARLEIPEGHIAQAIRLAAAALQREPVDGEAVEAALRQEWGGQYDENVRAARVAVEVFGLRSWLDRHGLGDDPDLVRWAVEVGKPLLLVADRKAQIEVDPNFLNKWTSPEKHAALKAEWQAIFRRLYG